MNPTNDHEQAIKDRVDSKARAIAEGTGSWEAVEAEMKIAVPFEMTSSDEQFFENYVAWVRQHPSGQ